MKKFFSLAVFLTTSCAYDQTPAPYEVYGRKFYGKDSANDFAANTAAQNKSGEFYSSDPNEYNRRIDQQNSTQIVSRPIVNSQPAVSRPVYGNEVYSQPLTTDSSGNIRRPLTPPAAIDSDQQTVSLGSRQNIHAGSTMGNSYSSAPYQQQNESIPPLEGRENEYLNLSHLNQERKAEDRLSNIKPVSKPAGLEEDDEIAEDEIKIKPKIERIETSSGAIGKSTETMMSRQAEHDEESEEMLASEQDRNTLQMPTEKSSLQSSTEVAKVEPAKIAVRPAASGATPQFIKPVDGVVISEFGSNKTGGGLNDGINIQAPEGTPVKAASGGTVVYSGNQLQGYGNLIIIRHANGYLSAYSHMKELELKKGASVSQGDIVGHVGKTGNVETPQLHFGIRKGREPVDPKNYL